MKGIRLILETLVAGSSSNSSVFRSNVNVHLHVRIWQGKISILMLLLGKNNITIQKKLKTNSKPLNLRSANKIFPSCLKLSISFFQVLYLSLHKF